LGGHTRLSDDTRVFTLTGTTSLIGVKPFTRMVGHPRRSPAPACYRAALTVHGTCRFSGFRYKSWTTIQSLLQALQLPHRDSLQSSLHLLIEEMFRAASLVTLLSAVAALANPIILNTTSREVQLEKRFDNARFTFYDVGLWVFTSSLSLCCSSRCEQRCLRYCQPTQRFCAYPGLICQMILMNHF
jgi:hypothetical protein